MKKIYLLDIFSENKMKACKLSSKEQILSRFTMKCTLKKKTNRVWVVFGTIQANAFGKTHERQFVDKVLDFYEEQKALPASFCRKTETQLENGTDLKEDLAELIRMRFYNRYLR